MSQLFRAMRDTGQAAPEVGPTGRTLGVRPGIDVVAVQPEDMVNPGQGGLSISPDDPLSLPRHRRPPEFGGTGRDPVWMIDTDDLGSDLQYRPDPTNTGHGFIEPARPMTRQKYDEALARTQSSWRKLAPPTEEAQSDEPA